MYDVIFIGEKIKSPELKSLCIDPESLVECRGEIGSFQLKYKKEEELNNEESKYIIINLKAKRDNPIEETYGFDYRLEDLAEEEDIIFIQDYDEISPAVINRQGLKKAIAAKENYKNSEVYYLFRSMRFIDDNDSLYEEARKMGIIFLKYEMENIKIKEDNTINYKRGDLDLDLTGQILTAPLLKPDEKIKRVARLLNIEMSDKDYIQSENIYLQPTLTGKRGVYSLAGARGPNAYSDLDLEIEYTLNEIKSNLNDFEPLTERKREVDDQKCILCYTCYRVCPHGAVEKDEELDAMKINELACYGCDACISHCPADAISYVEEESKETNDLNLKVLMCENSADTAFEKLDKSQFKDLDIEKIPCASSIKKDEIFTYLRKKDSRLLVLGCFEESCKHLTGDGRGERIVNEVKETLSDLELGENRVRFERLSPRMEEDLNDFLLRWKEGVNL
ncbi:MAG TPA: hydrogenase iron-sulfur subunit [Halanaerobiales bacterium]|nr:hydrogenase iron-sulfur subunit [Halanaerobiales bacterium]